MFGSKSVSALLAVIAIQLATGCASIVSKSDWPVTVDSSPSEASFVIETRSGRKIHEGVTPSVVTVRASEGYFNGADYQVRFEKAGYESVTVPFNSRLNGWYVGNLVFGGLIGFLIVDPATGAMWKMPDKLTTTLAQQSAAPAAATGAAPSTGMP